ncbi:UNVERIFIED_CONTAM: hypothetical protein Slati_2641200 [Sesamum latifolium]|uniref:Uncharacterized protein n=1 Tax=Sesamum latifolium TaxID=2727402 RepID=A0AAW2VTS6_9LAMI
MLEVQELRIDMMIIILIHGLKKGFFALALARDPPEDVEQLMRMAQKYIDEEDMNVMKDGERQQKRGQDRGRDRRMRLEKDREPPYLPKYRRYTPLATTRVWTLMMVEKANVLPWPKHTRLTLTKNTRVNIVNSIERGDTT